MLEFYIHSLAGIAFLLDLTVISHLKSFSNLHFIELAAEMFLGDRISVFKNDTLHNR